MTFGAQEGIFRLSTCYLHDRQLAPAYLTRLSFARCPPPKKKSQPQPIQVEALSQRNLQVEALTQRRLEQAAAAGATAPTARARGPSAGLSLPSAHSKRPAGAAAVLAESGRGLELTDAYEELQAFFEGGTRSDRRTPTSSTKVGASVCPGDGGQRGRGPTLSLF